MGNAWDHCSWTRGSYLSTPTWRLEIKLRPSINTLKKASGRESVREPAKMILLVLGIGLAEISVGCSVRSAVTSMPPRLFREVHGLRVRSYPIKQVSDDLRLYRAVEVHQLENLMLDQIPEPTVRQLNMAIVNRIRSLNHFDRISEVDESMSAPVRSMNVSSPGVKVDGSQSELVVEGYIDDYTPGIPMLRLIEQGDNHAVLTVRIRLEDKQSARVLGEKNITVETSRVTSNARRMVEKAAEEIGNFIDRSTTRYKNP